MLLFFRKGPKQFSAANAGLKTKLYVIVSKREDAKGKYLLRLARVEIHSANALFLRNEALFDLANSQGITFEGWSVDGQEMKQDRQNEP